MNNKRIIIDLDKTITQGGSEGYEEELPQYDVVKAMRNYKELGFDIVIHTARNMRSHNGNVGVINVKTLPKIISWLEKHAIPFDEIIVGKPWCGKDGFYVDDRAIRPKEFSDLSYDEIINIIEGDK